ncbi:MAG: hypothetical protein ABFC96_06435 [Thermoguttaceae bacterium]
MATRDGGTQLPWSRLWRWRHPEVTEDVPPLTSWPVERPRRWLLQVNRPQSKADLDALHTSVQRGRPFGSAAWQATTAENLGLAAGQGNANNWTCCRCAFLT